MKIYPLAQLFQDKQTNGAMRRICAPMFCMDDVCYPVLYMIFAPATDRLIAIDVLESTDGPTTRLYVDDLSDLQYSLYVPDGRFFRFDEPVAQCFSRHVS